MKGSTRPERYNHIVALCILALLLAVAWPALGEAQAVPQTGALEPDTGPPSLAPAPVRPTPTPSPTPSPTPNSPSGDNGDPFELPGDPTGGNGSKPLPDPTLTKHEIRAALAPNRIVLHAATPAQLIKVEDGLQYYFIGRDGKTRLGPWIPSFAELAEKYPDGEEASIYLGSNPFTGKRVKIDYLPTVNRIRVDTFYADREHDKNKHYIFHFGPQHDITYDAW